MGLVIPDIELRTISGEVLAIPGLIASFNAQLVQAQLGKDNSETKDNGNKVFFDFFLSLLVAYHAEKKEINSIIQTDYIEQTLIDSAKQIPNNLHFPTSPIWVNLIPKVILENNGDPTSNLAIYEQNTLALITVAIITIKTGFTDGAITDMLTTAYVVGVDIEVDNGGFVTGQRIVVDASGISLLAIIVAVKAPSTTGAEDLQLNVIAAALGALGVGSRVRNFHPGWPNAEREETISLVEPEVLHHFESLIDSEVDDWETTLDNQLTALATNSPGGSEDAEIATAITNANDAKADVDTWQAAPATGAGVGKYGDATLLPLENRNTTRTTQTGTRITQIAAALGAVSQNPDGAFSGSGHYNSLFTWIDIRIKKGSGTLFQFFNFDQILNFIQSQIDTQNSKKAEYDNVLLVKVLSTDAVATTFAALVDVTGLSISDTIKVVSDDESEPIVTADIIDIQGNIIELDQTIISALVSDGGRIVKELI